MEGDKKTKTIYSNIDCWEREVSCNDSILQIFLDLTGMKGLNWKRISSCLSSRMLYCSKKNNQRLNWSREFLRLRQRSAEVVRQDPYYVNPRLSWISPDIRHYIKIRIVLLEYFTLKGNKISTNRTSIDIF